VGPGDRCLSSVLGLFGRGLTAREQQIELAPSFLEDLACLGNVSRVSRAADLRCGCQELEDLLTEIAVIAADRAGSLCPRCGTGGELGRFLLSGIGQFEDPTSAVRLDGPNKPFVLELLQGWVDGSGTCTPRAFTAAFELLDDLVPVRLLLGEEHENRGPDVAACSTPAVAAEASGTTEAGESGVAREPGIVEWRPSTPVAVAAAALQALADVMVEAPGGFSKTVRRLLVVAVVGSFSGHVHAPWR
jgi:hypothetical protein